MRNTQQRNTSQRVCRWVIIVVLGSLVSVVSAADVPPPVLAVPRLSIAPVIDGAVGEEEWAAAAVVDGFEVLTLRTAPRDRTRAWLGYDADHLYVAVRCWMPPGTQPRAVIRKRDDAVFTDDAVELLLDPGRRSRWFQFVGNSIGTKYDAQEAASAWDAAWSYVARPTDFGWEAEWSLPFASLGRPTPQEGEIWGLLIGRDAWTPTNEFSQWGSCRVSWHAPAEFGSLIFRSDPPRIVLREIVARGLRVNVMAEAIAPLKVPAAVTLRARVMSVVRTLSGFGREQPRVDQPVLVFNEPPDLLATELSHHKETIELAAGERRPLTLPTLPEHPGSFVLEIHAVDDQGKPLLVQRIPLEVIAPLGVEVRRFPTAGVLEIHVDTTPSSRKAEIATVGCRLEAEDGREWWTEIRPAKDGQAEFRWNQLGKLTPGRHRLRVWGQDGQGQVVVQHIQYLRKDPWPWLGNNLGREETVIPPWTPVRRVGPNAVEVWGRRYTFGSTGLPSSIITGGVELLAEPARLLARREGQPIQFVPAGELTFEPGDTRTRIIARSHVKGREDLTLEVATTVEFDGFAWMELTLAGPPGAALDQLWLEFPLRAQHARYRLPVFNDPVSLPPEGLTAPVVWRTDWAARKTVGLYWVGDEDRGLVLSAEDDRNWRPADREKALALVPAGDQVIWRAHLADRPVPLDPPLSIALCWQATPARPVDKWYAHRVVGDGSYGMVKRDQPRAVTLRYPADRILRHERGALEIDAVILFDPSAPEEQVVDPVNNRDFFRVDLTDRGELYSFWAASAWTLTVVEAIRGQDRARLYGGWRPKLGQRFRLSYVWGDAQALYLDGQLMATVPVKGLHGMRPGAVLTLGGGKSQWLIVAVKTSTESRITTEGELTADEHTLLLERFDQLDRLDGGRTRPVVAPDGVVGEVSTGGSLDVRHGVRGLALDSFVDPLSGAQAAYNKGIRVMHIHEPWTEIMGYPGTFVHQADLKALMEEAHRVGMRYALYSHPVISSIAPEFEEWGNEWSLAVPLLPAFTRTPPQNIYFTCHGSTWSDFYIWKWVQMIREYGVNGMYLDGTHIPLTCTNPYHEHAYRAPDGKTYPTHPIRAAREFMKRLLRATRAVDPSFFLLGHVQMPFTGHFLDFIMTGENFGLAPHNFEIPLDYLRVVLGRQWGTPMEIYTTAIILEPYATPLGLLHGIGTWGRGYQALFHTFKRPIWDIWEKFGIEEAEFVGYWRGSPHVTSSHPDVKVSYHLKPGQVLLAVASPKREPPAATITVDLAGLGLNPATLRVATGNGRPLDVAPDADGKLRLRFPEQTNIGYYVWLQSD